MKLQGCNLFQEVSALREQKTILPWGYCGLVSRASLPWLQNAQLAPYQRPASIQQRIILRLILKGVNLLWLLLISLGRSTDTFRNHIPSPRPLVEYLLRLQNLHTKWDRCLLLSQIRYMRQKTTGDNDFWQPAACSILYL